MRAITLENSESAPAVGQIPNPEISGNEVLARVRAASLNAIDVKIAEGAFKPADNEYPIMLGKDFAGVVEAVGPEVTRCAVGDEIVGFLAGPGGTFAEYVGIAEEFVAAKPTNFDFAEAAGLPLAGCTALMVVDALNPSKGDRVLIVGATGGVGSFVVQLAAARGAQVIATAKPEDDAEIRAFGATETIDYSRHDVAEVIREMYSDGIEAMADLVNYQPDAFAKFAELVASGGRVASVLGAADVEQLAAKNVTAANVSGNPSVLGRVVELAESGVLRVNIQHVYKFEEASQAFQDFRNMHTLGKLIISIC